MRSRILLCGIFLMNALGCNSADLNCETDHSCKVVTEQSVFVDGQHGDDAQDCTQDHPCKTLKAGIDKAQKTEKTTVYVTQGLYEESLILVDGISIAGGYQIDADRKWVLGESGETLITNPLYNNSPSGGIWGEHITTPTTLSRLHVRAKDGDSAINAGQSTYGLYCNDCKALALVQVNIEAGAGASGKPGQAGAPGTAGLDGEAGKDSPCVADTAGGGGGTSKGAGSPMSGRGGAGGNSYNIPNQAGYDGFASVGQIAGGLAGEGGKVPQNGISGDNAWTPGKLGTTGAGGAEGEITAKGWISAAGQPGTNGSEGIGGGGGGGGGGTGSTYTGGTMRYPGAGGGSGGSGGEGGMGGWGGQGGGGSFGLLAIDSDGLAIKDSSIRSNNGGEGGAGGPGGTGGRGGANGPGGKSNCGTGYGGQGGSGSRGGEGGFGGGGAGGPSWSVYTLRSKLSIDNTKMFFGTGGVGGASDANQSGNGTPGAAGEIMQK